ncbi:MAG: LysR substrate-binding domain-containing protein [Pseudomonadota bacterium]
MAFERIVRNVRLRQLRCFVTVAQKGSFVAAADELGLTQPAVSRSVAELESIVGHTLFDRSQRGARLTWRGQSLLNAAEAGLLQISQGLNVAASDGAQSETIRVGALPNVCSQFLPDVIGDFKRDYPSVVVRILTGTNAALLQDLRVGDTDFVLGRLSSNEDMRGLVFETLFDEPLIFVVRRGHSLAQGKPNIEDVLEFPLLLPPKGTIIRQELDRYFASQAVTHLPNAVETTSSDFQRTYLAKTEAVCVLPRGVFLQDLADGDVTSLALGEAELTGPVGLTTNPEVPQSPTMADLLARIRGTSYIPISV